MKGEVLCEGAEMGGECVEGVEVGVWGRDWWGCDGVVMGCGEGEGGYIQQSFYTLSHLLLY